MRLRRSIQLRWLARVLQHRVPQFAVRIEPPPASRDEVQRQMHVRAMPAADQHIRLAGHRGVDRVLREAQAVHVILCGRGHAADQIARVDVFEVERNPPPLEERCDPVLQVQSDDAQLAVA